MPTENKPTTPEPQEPEKPEGAKPENFDSWLEGQDEPIKELVAARFQTLENTVKATRDERDGLSKQIRGLAKKADEGSEIRRSLEEASAKLEETERRADFLEQAIKPEVQCRNPRAAWVIAQNEGHFDKAGRPNWDAIKAEAPELFGVVSANANAGNGTGTPPPKTQDMNAFIRAAAGRNT